MIRRAIVLIVALVLLGVSGVVGADPARAGDRRLPRTCGPVTRRVGTGVSGATPVLFVHGFSGSPGDFRRRLTSAPTMLESVEHIDGAVPYLFDYASRSRQWVTDPAIGRALAEAIVCLRRASGRKVMVIAHSMGGLATRYAQNEVVGGTRVASAIAAVVTIGTPTEGVILLSFTSGKIGDVLVQAAVDAIGDACKDPPGGKRRRLCALLEAASAPAVSAMTPDSEELAALPRWRRGLRVRTIAADLRLRLSIFGFGTTVSLGDIVAEVSSATADGTARPIVLACHTGLTDLFDVVDESPCSHANEVANRRVIRAVVDEVQRVVDAETEKRSSSP